MSIFLIIQIEKIVIGVIFLYTLCMFNFFKNSLSKIYSTVTSKFASVFQGKLDESSIEEIRKILISSDAGIKTTNAVIEELKNRYKSGQIKDGSDLKLLLKEILLKILDINFDYNFDVCIMLGINGSGKTTFCAKLANFYKSEGKRVLLVAADTFRAAAVDQLESWSLKIGVDLYKGKVNQDPASVVFGGCNKFKNENYDILIIDTAGRLQTKSHLMQELSKIKKVILKQLDCKISALLTLDSMLGQNSLEQAKLFNESTELDGLILTKLDGTGKGAFVFNVANEFKIPVAFTSFGEKLSAFARFDGKEYVNQLLDE